MKKRILEAKNLDEVKKESISIFNVSLDDLSFEVIKEKKGILGIGSSVTVEVTLNIDPFEETLKYLNAIMEQMDIDAKIEMITSNKEVKYNIFTNHNPILIGREGRTLDSLQHITRQVINRFSDERIICSVDIGGYKQKRITQLEILATKTAKEVARTKVPVKLDPMNSYERRIIHTKLAEWRDVYTESVGESPNRRLIIKPRRKR
ncbi:RNA-binding cell elongation regulator Jag/EloR [Haloplasma contractile]|uniref:Jag protein n=1 Tax=Haloplasma contractile SSD-17B TaxID=1033810 RepID=F7PWT3_9MOLU|nr:RNA-binding cell elongation regulator Jag/EloR [Haloplasma contractile]ERJ12542.1 Jag protein [Haloplasma contractile SSD-17B]